MCDDERLKTGGSRSSEADREGEEVESNEGKRESDPVAPLERVPFTYFCAKDGRERELPFRILVMGDFLQRDDTRLVGARETTSVTPESFDTFMEQCELRLDLTVPDRLCSEEGAPLRVRLEPKCLADLEPGAIARTVPELEELLHLRRGLVPVGTMLGALPRFGKRLQQCLADPDLLRRLERELQS